MEEFERDIDGEFIDASEKLDRALENHNYSLYSIKKGPLTLDQLPEAMIVSPALGKVIEQYGWPNANDQIIDTSVVHTASTLRTQLTPPDRASPQDIHTSMFFSMLATRPIGYDEEPQSGLEIYGTMPVLHRAHAVAPDLFGPLQIYLSTTRRRFGFTRNYDTDHILTALDQTKGFESMALAYNIMRRLLKADDTIRLHERLGGNGSKLQPVTNAEDALLRSM